MTSLSHDLTEGEKRVYNLLQQLPQDEFRCYLEPRVDREKKTSRYPDFMITRRSKGVLALEVKDWLEIVRGDSRQVSIKRRGSDYEETRENPERTARDYAHNLKEFFEKCRELLIEYKGAEKLYFPCEGIAILPQLPMSTVSALETAGIFRENRVLSWDDLTDVDSFLKALDRIQWTFPLRMPLKDEALGAIEYALSITRIGGRKDKYRIGDVTEEQETIILSPVPSLKAGSYVHLVRGSVGSGKTIVLTKRVQRLANLRPDWKILVTSFHLDITRDLHERVTAPNIKVKAIYDLCKEILGDKYPQAENYRGELGPRAIRSWTSGEEKFINELGLRREIVESEIARRKDARLNDTNAYLDDLHSRRRGLTPDQQDGLCFIYDLYQEYQERLKASGQEWADWEDVQQLTLDELHGHRLQRHFDAVFIDEAQDFSPQMMEIVKRLLKPGGYLFMCDDPVQCLWREFNWKDKRIKPDKEEVLSYPLRTTQSIMNLAQGLLDAEPHMRSEHDWDTYPSSIHVNVDAGVLPTLIQCHSTDEELRYVDQLLSQMIAEGQSTKEIAIMCPTYLQSEDWKRVDCVSANEIHVNHFNRIKGLEFDTVIIPNLHTILSRSHHYDEDRVVLPLRKLFVAVTRARKQLIMTYSQALPKQLEVLKKYCDTEIRETTAAD